MSEIEIELVRLKNKIKQSQETSPEYQEIVDKVKKLYQQCTRIHYFSSVHQDSVKELLSNNSSIIKDILDHETYFSHGYQKIIYAFDEYKIPEAIGWIYVISLDNDFTKIMEWFSSLSENHDNILLKIDILEFMNSDQEYSIHFYNNNICKIFMKNQRYIKYLTFAFDFDILP
jgi:hypothetical protein